MLNLCSKIKVSRPRFCLDCLKGTKITLNISIFFFIWSSKFSLPWKPWMMCSKLYIFFNKVENEMHFWYFSINLLSCKKFVSDSCILPSKGMVTVPFLHWTKKWLYFDRKSDEIYITHNLQGHNLTICGHVTSASFWEITWHMCIVVRVSIYIYLYIYIVTCFCQVVGVHKNLFRAYRGVC